MSHLVSYKWLVQENTIYNINRFVLQELEIFARRVSDCEELVGFIHKRCGIRFWKIVKRNSRFGSYIFNWCSVQIPLLPS